MVTKKYIPTPISTSDVVLSEEITELSEQIAKNVHEVWAATRIADGWTWGEERNDALKKHPCLIPYEELPDSEREYDRNTALETIKLIQKFGFNIERNS